LKQWCSQPIVLCPSCLSTKKTHHQSLVHSGHMSSVFNPSMTHMSNGWSEACFSNGFFIWSVFACTTHFSITEHDSLLVKLIEESATLPANTYWPVTWQSLWLVCGRINHCEQICCTCMIEISSTSLSPNVLSPTVQPVTQFPRASTLPSNGDTELQFCGNILSWL